MVVVRVSNNFQALVRCRLYMPLLSLNMLIVIFVVLTPLIKSVSRFSTCVSVQHNTDTCDYIELCHCLKVVFVSACQ